jgi:cell division protease FtsH
VSFAPNPRRGMGMSPVVRTVLFWALMFALAAVLWQTNSRSKNGGPSNQISYSDFLLRLDKNNIASATFALSQNTADVSGNLREPVQEYRTTVPKENVTDLTDRLRKAGANVSVSESSKQNWQTYLANLAPLLLLVGFWIFMMQRMRRGQNFPSNTPGPPDTSSTPSNTPL